MGRVPSIIGLTLSPAPPIHVTVSSGSGWLTTAIAVLGLVLASLSLGWQFFTWHWAGSRVQVEATFGAFPARMGQDEVPSALVIHLSDGNMRALRPQGFPRVMVVATIRNAGRLPVTIQRCKWQNYRQTTEIIELPDAALGALMPHRLGAHDQCISVIHLETIMTMFDTPYLGHGNPVMRRREVWPVVEVGNKRRPVRGKALAIPTA
jgi:hypothetical protein